MATAVMLPTPAPTSDALLDAARSRPPSSSSPSPTPSSSSHRRGERPRWASHSPKGTLDAVPEDGHSVIRKTPPTAYKPSADNTVWVDRKGKRLAAAPRNTTTARDSAPVRADWTLDITETAKGSEAWAERERTVLVLGTPTASDLAPILYNPAFANTLLLVGTVKPAPSITALNSPSLLLRQGAASAGDIFPTVQPFNLPANYPHDKHPLPALLAQASSLAKTYRRPSSNGLSISRKGSNESLGNRTPLRTCSSNNLHTDNASRTSLESSLRTRPPSLADFQRSPSESSLFSLRRISSNFGLEGGLKSPRSRSESTGSSSNSALFDVVINFVPPATHFTPERAMQDMLHQAVVVTSGLMPELTRSTSKSCPDTLSISLLHVLPSQVPQPLPVVIESFLLGLLPKFANVGDRNVWSSVITRPVWSATPYQTGGTTFSGAEILLYGGVRSYPPAGCPEISARAFLPNWAAIVSNAGSFGNQPRRVSQSPLSLDPGSIGYTSKKHRAPSSLRQRIDEPGTPELDPMSSSSSSNSAVGEFGSATASSEDGPLPTTPVDRPKKGFMTWFKNKSKKRL